MLLELLPQLLYSGGRDGWMCVSTDSSVCGTHTTRKKRRLTRRLVTWGEKLEGRVREVCFVYALRIRPALADNITSRRRGVSLGDSDNIAMTDTSWSCVRDKRTWAGDDQDKAKQV